MLRFGARPIGRRDERIRAAYDARASEGILTMTLMQSALLGSASLPNAAPLGASLPGCFLSVASAGDHLAIRALLMDGGREGWAGEFQAQLEEPTYEPTDRLVIRNGAAIAAHVHLRNRELNFGSRRIPATWLADLITAPKFRRRGLGSSLVAAAERQALADGAELALVRTTQPRLFQRRGWVAWGRPSYSRAGAREILAHLVRRQGEPSASLEGVFQGARPAPLTTRLWRHVEQAALERMYHHHTQGSYGPPVRSSDYWRWLVSRHGFDAIYVAVAGRDRWSLDAKGIVGYALVKQDRVVELFTAPERPDAGESLMARVCGEFIEQDRCDLRLDAAPNHPWHAELIAAGGEYSNPDSEAGSVSLARILDAPRFLAKLSGEFSARASRANLPVGAELAIRCGSLAARLVVVADGEVQVLLDAPSERAVECDAATLSQWLLGHLRVDAPPTAGRIVRWPDRESLAAAKVLFPKLPYWRPVWDDLPA